MQNKHQFIQLLGTVEAGRESHWPNVKRNVHKMRCPKHAHAQLVHVNMSNLVPTLNMVIIATWLMTHADQFMEASNIP